MSKNSPNSSGASELAFPHEDAIQRPKDQALQDEFSSAEDVSDGGLQNSEGSSSTVKVPDCNPALVVPALQGLSALHLEGSGKTEAVEFREVEELGMRQQGLEDLFEWEKLSCETPYYLQGENGVQNHAYLESSFLSYTALVSPG